MGTCPGKGSQQDFNLCNVCESFHMNEMIALNLNISLYINKEKNINFFIMKDANNLCFVDKNFLFVWYVFLQTFLKG